MSWAIVPPADSFGRDLAEMIRDIIRHPERYVRNENENMRRDGERVWVLWTNKALLDADGRVSGLLCIGSDITDRKKAEDALRLDEARLEVLVELSRMAGASMKEIANFALEQQVTLTKSRIGWLRFIDEKTFSRSRHAQRGHAPVRHRRMPVHSCLQAVFGPVFCRRLINRLTAQSCNPKQAGRCLQLSRHRCVRGWSYRGSCLRNNKDEDYDATDVRQLTLLMDGMEAHPA
jgi:hypothetical protein